MKKLILTMAAGLSMTLSLNADIIWTNPILGTNPGGSNPYTTGQSSDSNITVSGIGHGSGVDSTLAVTPLVDNLYAATGWANNGTQANALATAEYFTFTLTPDAGYEINFENLEFQVQGDRYNALILPNAVAPPRSFAVYSSVGGFTLGNEIYTFTQPGTGAYGPVFHDVPLTDPAFQNVTGPIEFRVYGWGAGTSNAFNYQLFSINNFSFNGEVVAVPEPTSATLLLGGTGLMLWMARRRRARLS